MLRSKAREAILNKLNELRNANAATTGMGLSESLLSALESAGLRFEEEGEEMETLTLTPFINCEELRYCHVWMKDEANDLEQWKRGEWGYSGRSYEVRLPASAWAKGQPRPIPVDATEVK